jgi:hypothetical protein
VHENNFIFNDIRINVNPPSELATNWAQWRFKYMKMDSTDKQHRYDYYRSMSHRHYNPNIAPIGIDNDIDRDASMSGLPDDYQYHLHQASTVPEMTMFVDVHYPSETFSRYDSLVPQFKDPSMISVINLRTLNFFVRVLRPESKPSELYNEFWYQVMEPAEKYQVKELIPLLQEVFVCTGEYHEHGVLRHSLLLLNDVIKNAMSNFFSKSKTKQKVKQEAIYSLQATLLAMIYWSYRSMFIDVHFLQDIAVTDEMQSMLDRGVKDHKAIIKQHSKVVKEMFLKAKKDLLSPEMVVLFHKIFAFPEKKHSASTYPNVMHLAVLRDIEATAKHYMKEIESDDDTVEFHPYPDPIFPSDFLDAPDIPQGLLPPELVAPQPTSNDSRLDSATSASTPIKSNVSKGPNVDEQIKSNVSKGPNVDDQDDTFDNQDDISVGSGNTANSRFSGSEDILNAATLPTETSSSIKRRKSGTFGGSSSDGSPNKKKKAKSSTKAKKTSPDFNSVKGSSSQSSSDGVDSSHERSPNKKKAKTSTRAKKTSPQKSKKSESNSLKSPSKLSTSRQKKSGHARPITIAEGEPLPVKTSLMTIDGKFLRNDSNVRPELITDEVMQQNWIEAQKNPEMGLHYINNYGEVVEITTSSNVLESMKFKEQMGIVSRKDKDFKKVNPDYVQFKGNPTPLNMVPIFAISSPNFLKDCPDKACHLVPPNLSDPVVQRLEGCNILFLDAPMFQCHRCKRHLTRGCGESLKVGDFIKVDGFKPAPFVKGKVWFFTAVKIDHTEHSHQCGVGIVKCFATQAKLVVNRVGVVMEIVPRMVTDNRTMNIEVLCKHAKVKFVDTTMPQYKLLG